MTKLGRLLCPHNHHRWLILTSRWLTLHPMSFEEQSKKNGFASCWKWQTLHLRPDCLVPHFLLLICYNMLTVCFVCFLVRGWWRGSRRGMIRMPRWYWNELYSSRACVKHYVICIWCWSLPCIKRIVINDPWWMRFKHSTFLLIWWRQHALLPVPNIPRGG